MKKSMGDNLADRFASHDVNLSRLEASNARVVLKTLKKLEDDLVGKIAKHADGNAPFTLARSQALLKEVRTTIKTYYDDVVKENTAQMKDLAEYELNQSSVIVNKALGAEVLSVGVPMSVVNSMVKEDTALGVPLKTFWDQQSTALRQKFTSEIRAGVFAGETMGDMVRRVRGTKAKGFKDGIMESSRRGAEAVVRTASQSILNDARMKTFQENADVLSGVQVQATLDGRTSEICIARSRSAWDFEGDPIPGTETEESFPGPPPWHVNCRSTLIPIVKSIEEITGKKGKEIPEGTQASMDGQVAEKLTYEDWLRTKPESFQKDVLGEGKFQLWKAGKIGLRDLIDQRGRPLTLKELKGKK